jgi:hypothetical protein
MVGTRRSKTLFPVLILALLVLWGLQPVTAQGIGEDGGYSLREEYRIEINALGDARITDTITYDSEWFADYGYLFEENPNLLTRRYRADSNVGEVEGFGVDIDDRASTITVTFETPGLAYRLSDGWTVFGYGDYELVEEGDDEIILQAAWSIANEFSLFDAMNLEETVIIDLPDGAVNAAFDTSTGAIEYDLAYAAGGGGMLADNRTVFTIIFALAMAASLILLLYVFTRGTSSAAAAVAAGTPAPAAQVQPVSLPQAAAAEPQAPAPRFCKKCGEPKSRPDERFCRKCGAPYG